MANRLNVEMNLDLTAFEKSLNRLQARLTDLSKRMQQTGQTLSQNLTLPILGVGAAAVKAFGDMERLENGLTAIMGSSERDLAQGLIGQAGHRAGWRQRAGRVGGGVSAV